MFNFEDIENINSPPSTDKGKKMTDRKNTVPVRPDLALKMRKCDFNQFGYDPSHVMAYDYTEDDEPEFWFDVDRDHD